MQKFKNKSPLSLEKKKKLLPAPFLVKFVVLPPQSIRLALSTKEEKSLSVILPYGRIIPQHDKQNQG